MPTDNMYRPPMVYNRPVMYGPQSALVTGPKGEEIYIDEEEYVEVGTVLMEFKLVEK